MTTAHSWPTLLNGLFAGGDLSIAQSEWAMSQVMSGDATPSQLGALLATLRLKGETVDEIVGFRDAVLAAAVPLGIGPDAVDIVGTGGDPYGAVINISSVASIVTASLGVPVIKHGNRAASSSSGASDVLAQLGVNLDASPDLIRSVFDREGIAFIHAAAFHPGFRHAGPTRRELGVSTLFNILGPLCNPARPAASAVGVADASRVPLVVGVFQTRGATALVYRGDDGIDKLTTTGHSRVWEIVGGVVAEHDIDPLELGIPRSRVEDLLGQSPEHNAAIARSVLAGEPGPARDIVALNAAAGVVAYRLSKDAALVQTPIRDRFAAALVEVSDAIDSGAAAAKLEAWARASRGDDEGAEKRF